MSQNETDHLPGAWYAGRMKRINLSPYLLLGIFTALVGLTDIKIAQAFDIEPEYQGISETFLDRIESPRELDGEYQSIINSYTISPTWDQAYARSRRAVDTSIGSITNQHFMIYTRAKLETDLSESLRFKFTFFAQQDREINDSRHVFELSQRVLSWLRVNAYAQMAHYKRDNDIGFALVITPIENWDHRLYLTYHDFTRGNHNDQPDRYLGNDPLTVGWSALYDHDGLWIRSGVRFDQSARWNRPQEQFIFDYEKKLAFADARISLSERDAITLRAQWDSTFKGRTPTGTGTVLRESFKAERLLLKTAYAIGTEDDSLSYEFGFMYAGRHWTDQNGAQVFHQNLLPSITSRIRSVRRESGFDHVQLSVEATDFRTYGDLALTPVNQKHESLEGRLQTAYEFAFRNDARLLVAFNFDLDEWGGLPTFDGGNLQFRSEF